MLLTFILISLVINANLHSKKIFFYCLFLFFIFILFLFLFYFLILFFLFLFLFFLKVLLEEEFVQKETMTTLMKRTWCVAHVVDPKLIHLVKNMEKILSSGSVVFVVM